MVGRRLVGGEEKERSEGGGRREDSRLRMRTDGRREDYEVEAYEHDRGRREWAQKSSSVRRAIVDDVERGMDEDVIHETGSGAPAERACCFAPLPLNLPLGLSSSSLTCSARPRQQRLLARPKIRPICSLARSRAAQDLGAR